MESPRPGTELSVVTGRPAHTGPSPSRFPTPILPRASRPAPVVEAEPIAEPEPEPAPAPPPAHTSRLPPPMQPLGPVHSHREAGRGARPWQVLIGSAAVLVLLALCGLTAAALIVDRDPEVPGTPAAAPVTAPHRTEPQNIDSRDTDQAPLTTKEVFGTKRLTLDGTAPYQVLRTHSSGSCATAATGEVADLLARVGCSQVVRGTLRSPDGRHLVTAGLFNLPDVANAERARDRIRELLDERQGRFQGMPAGDDTAVLGTAPSRVGWQVRGHYLAFTLVVRAAGESIPSGDPTVRDIMFDLIELHLDKTVLEARANGGTAGQPNPDLDGRTGDGTSPDGD
ncbi:hypothetical protein ABT336_07270 [Micromonospora sp. NPDC000207]|uniref:hypothetical protein n=1 Tax=Micromonospora sp. NPDC000207 TaxID=3154246 RepID=UPI00331C105C